MYGAMKLVDMENFYIVEIDKKWNKFIVIPYRLIKCVGTHNYGISFVIEREKLNYKIKREKGISLKDYVNNINILFEKLS